MDGQAMHWEINQGTSSALGPTYRSKPVHPLLPGPVPDSPPVLLQPRPVIDLRHEWDQGWGKVGNVGCRQCVLPPQQAKSAGAHVGSTSPR